MLDENPNPSFINALSDFFGHKYPVGNRSWIIVYQAFRFPSQHQYPAMQYLAILTMVPDLIVMYLLGILAVRRDLHMVGILAGALPCLLPKLFFKSASAALLCYFTVYLCCFSCMIAHDWQKGLKRLRAQRTTSISYLITVSAAAMTVNWILEEVSMSGTLGLSIGGSCWAIVWWKIHRKYAPNIYARVSKHWISELLMLRNTCWISDLTAFECRNQMIHFKECINRDQTDRSGTNNSTAANSIIFDSVAI